MDNAANDLTAMMAEQNVPVAKGRKSPKLVWVVLICVVVGVMGGIVVYQQSIKTKTTVKSSPKPVVSKAPSVALSPNPSSKLGASPSASGSGDPTGINVVDDWEYGEYENDDDDLPGSASPSPSVRASGSPTASRSPSPVGSRSPTPSSSSRVAMPDTSGGVPETGVFEVTVGTVSVGLVLLVAGLVGLLVL